MKTLFLSLFLLVGSSVLAQDNNGKLKNFFKDKTKIENPFNLRDPFKAPISNRKKISSGFKRGSKGQYSNIAETPADQIPVSEIRLSGVLIGRERRALVNIGKDNKDQIVILKEGMKIGPEGAELKAILPGGIVLVEKIINVYGEEEYLETVIPISK